MVDYKLCNPKSPQIHLFDHMKHFAHILNKLLHRTGNEIRILIKMKFWASQWCDNESQIYSNGSIHSNLNLIVTFFSVFTIETKKYPKKRTKKKMELELVFPL